jgi:pimeloyl-ACP methyl ester carboxylesterase
MMATFALVHGGGHGMWQWGQLVAELDARGHESICMDLPISDPTAGHTEYAAAVVDALEGREDPVVVGHSQNGFTLPFVAEQIPVRILIWLAAFIQPGVYEGLPAVEDVLTMTPEEITPSADGLIRIPEAVAMNRFYHDVSPSVARWAFGQLRPQALKGTMPDRLPKFDRSTPVGSIICRDDRSVSPQQQRAVARDVLHVEPVELPGSHSPFLARPAQLADALDSLVRDRP